MNLSALKSFAPEVRLQLIEAVGRKLDYVLTADTADLRAKQSQRGSLREQAETDRTELIERVAYTWFNRLAALRFLDAEGRHPFQARVITAATTDETQPEVLRLMRMGSLPAELAEFTDLGRLNDLLDGRLPTATAGADPQGEVYRHLILAACRFYHAAMPFVFEAIDDETELLLPDDLLTPTSVAEPFRSKISDEDCQDVEIIGWLYQFYISEKKDEVFAALKKNKKITPENIPAATQLFTPNWIVRYLVENSLGRLWMLNRPNSRLVEKMDYYIKPEQEETDFLRINSPEEIKICDPACGSGHMLVYAFDLLYAIYEEEGYEPSSIPEKILTNNLFGVEIDERAGTLAAFALAMKARAKSRRFFRKPIQPNICVLRNIRFEEGELKEYIDFVGRDVFSAPMMTTLHQFQEADNFGSLIRPDVADTKKLHQLLKTKTVSYDSLFSPTHQKVLQALIQADYLSPKYHIVIANPPYKKKADLNGSLQSWLENSFADGKYDLYQAFILRNTELAISDGYVAMITMQGWMFAPRYETIRANILRNCCILSMAQLGERAFDSIGGEVVSTTAFILSTNRDPSLKGQFIRLTEGKNEGEKNRALLSAVKNTKSEIRFGASDDDFLKIPGQPLVFWASDQVRSAFQNYPTISEHIVTREGLTTGNNSLFLREWHEVSQNKVGYGIINEASAQQSKKRWFPYVKGGGSRRWFGNCEHFVNWFNDGAELKDFKDEKTGRVRSHNYNGIYSFRPGFTWSGISSNDFVVRDVSAGFMFDTKGPMGFVTSSISIQGIEAFLNSKVSSSFLRMLAPTLDFKLTHVLSLPLRQIDSSEFIESIGKNVNIAKADWNSYETSWDFSSLPLLSPTYHQPTLSETYQKLRTHWMETTLEMQRLEEKNNRIFIDAYGLRDELTPEVTLNEITLTCNPHYRYGSNKTEAELVALLQEDTAKELISYAVGCMFGRYSLDKPGLNLANQGESVEDYVQKVEKDKTQISFLPDDDAIIPILNGEWFEDDAVARVREFLRVTFGNETLETNLRWLEESIGKNLRAYFCANTGGFYDHHLKTYKKRPIYWMFQSPKKHFRALIYLHRYTKDTVNRVLDGYLREFMHKLRSRMEHLDHVLASDSTPTREATQARREKDQIIAALRDCEEYEREILLPLAQQRIELDLDDGVKVNYNKLGNALAKVTGLSGK